MQVLHLIPGNLYGGVETFLVSMTLLPPHDELAEAGVKGDTVAPRTLSLDAAATRSCLSQLSATGAVRGGPQ